MPGIAVLDLWILNHRIQITKETPEESHYRRNLGRVRCIHTMDKTTEPQGTSALSGLLSHFPMYFSPPAWIGLCNPRNPTTSQSLSSTTSIRSMSLTTEDSASNIDMVENANMGKKRSLSSPDASTSQQQKRRASHHLLQECEIVCG